MPLFYVTYDLMKAKDYPKLTDRLQKQYGAKKVLLSVWVFRGQSSSSAVLNDLKSYIDSDDRLLVIESANSSWIGPVLTDPNKA
jgi:hypothetical protein